jgi:hypothetical protein
MEWISVNDRLPEKGQQVNVYGTFTNEVSGARKSPSIGVVNWDNEKYSECNDYYYYEMGYLNITHWMPLPPPPTETK